MQSTAAIEAQPVQPALEEVKPSGWTLDLYTEAMTGLLSGYGVQAQAINDAIKAGTGFISREEVDR